MVLKASKVDTILKVKAREFQTAGLRMKEVSAEFFQFYALYREEEHKQTEESDSGGKAPSKSMSNGITEHRYKTWTTSYNVVQVNLKGC